MSRNRDPEKLLVPCSVAVANKYGRRGGIIEDRMFVEALFDIEDVIDGQPGDPGREWPLPERVKRVVEKLLAQRSKRF